MPRKKMLESLYVETQEDKELNENWQKGLKVAYWPDIAKREEPKDER